MLQSLDMKKSMQSYDHLVTNLLLEKDDFNLLPIVTHEGMNYRKLDKIFDGELEQIVKELNEAVLT